MTDCPLDLRDAAPDADGRLAAAVPFAATTPYPRRNRAAKHLLDRLIALALIVPLSPLMLACSAAIVIEGLLSPRARGPILYVQRRFSEGKPFPLLKYRSFYLDDEHSLAHLGDTVWFVNERPQTRVGFWLRKLYVDELPQLFNVLAGDMSIVGPRPWPGKQYEDALRRGYHAKRLLRGGLCGPVQAMKGRRHNFRNGLEMEEVLACNYLRRTSLGVIGLDLRLIGATLRTVLRAEGI